MRVNNVEKEIDGVSFQIHMLPYGEAQQLLFKANMLLTLKLNTELSEEGLLPLSTIIFAPGVDQKDVEYVINKLAEKTRVKEDGGQYMDLSRCKDVIFTGRMDLMFKWLDAALELNFASFLDELKKLASRQEKKQESQFQNILTGLRTE